MKRRNVIIILVVVIVVFLGLFTAGYAWYLKNYGGIPYYTQITTKGERISASYKQYKYDQFGYDKDGHPLRLKFTSGPVTRPLKMGAYLKVSYNQKRSQVISWEKVSKSDVPSKALTKLD